MNLFNIPNIDKNTKIEELEGGLKLTYTLSCPSTFPKIAFTSKGKCYVYKTITIPYQNNMSKAINYAYHKVKTILMIELALHKKFLVEQKLLQLAEKQAMLEEIRKQFK